MAVVAQTVATEYELKAAFIYNFAKFVHWPANTNNPGLPVTVGIVGKDPFGEITDRILAGKVVDGRPIVVKKAAGVGALGYCAILFVSVQDANKEADILNAVRERPVLTIGESPNFAERGGIIGLRIKDNKVRFAVNLEAAHRAKLQISSRLLQLAEIVREVRHAQ